MLFFQFDNLNAENMSTYSQQNRNNESCSNLTDLKFVKQKLGLRSIGCPDIFNYNSKSKKIFNSPELLLVGNQFSQTLKFTLFQPYLKIEIDWQLWLNTTNIYLIKPNISGNYRNSGL